MRMIAVVVSSIDGYITRHGGAATEWASPEDQKHFFRFLRSCDVSLMGGETYRASRSAILSEVVARRDRQASDGARPRRKIVWTRDPDTYAADGAPGLLEFTNEPLHAVVGALRRDGHQRCAVLGGGEVYGAMLAADLIDEIVLTLEPLAFGTGVRHTGTGHVINGRFSLAGVERLNPDTLLLTYVRPEPPDGRALPG